MKQITVLQLAKTLATALKNDKSLADKYIVVADDPEGNGYHGMFFTLTYKADEVKECIESSNGLYDSEEDLDKIVILG